MQTASEVDGWWLVVLVLVSCEEALLRVLDLDLVLVLVLVASGQQGSSEDLVSFIRQLPLQSFCCA